MTEIPFDISALSGLMTPKLIDTVVNSEILYMTVGYLLLKPLLQRSPLVVTTKGAYRNGMIGYNTTMSIFSFVCFVNMLAAFGWDYGLLQPLRDLTGDQVVSLYTGQCPSPVFSSRLFVYTAWAFYYSKYIEYMDTAWLVMKGKPVSFLQTFHHFGAPWDVWMGLQFQNEGLWIFIFLNAAIHTIMYAYYAVTAAGCKFNLKFLITMLQMAQFVLGFSLVWGYIRMPCFRETKEMVASWLLNYLYVGTVLALFINFFIMDNFMKKKDRAGAKDPGAKDAGGKKAL